MKVAATRISFEILAIRIILPVVVHSRNNIISYSISIYFSTLFTSSKLSFFAFKFKIITFEKPKPVSSCCILQSISSNVSTITLYGNFQNEAMQYNSPEKYFIRHENRYLGNFYRLEFEITYKRCFFFTFCFFYFLFFFNARTIFTWSYLQNLNGKG